MKWLYKILNAVPPSERKGILLEHPKWEVSACSDMPLFLLTLIGIIPEDSVLYLEGGYPDEEINLYFEKQKISKPVKVELGTIWPRPICYHIPFTSDNIKTLANIIERHATPEVAIHIHVYKDNKVLLQWHDAFDCPMYFAETVDEENIKIFCEKLSLKYKLLTVQST